MKLAIMQPYFFPYLGYFQLLRLVDVFVFLDDVDYIKGGWINRNRVQAQSGWTYFTVPLAGASSFAPINRTAVHRESYPRWRRRFLRTIWQTYARKPGIDDVLGLLDEVLEDEPRDIAQLAIESVRVCARRLGISTRLMVASTDCSRSATTGSERVREICRRLGAKTYVNAAGGRELYDSSEFARDGIQLAFLRQELELSTERMHLAELSILHLVATEGLEGARTLLPKCSYR